MRYRSKSGKQYAPARLKRKRFYEALKLKPVGVWSRDLLESGAGKVLQAKHWENVVKELQRAKPQNIAELKKTIKKATNTPQQRLLTLYETSLHRPLTQQEFVEYLTLFKENFPGHYETLYGKKTPKDIAVECMKDWKRVEG